MHLKNLDEARTDNLMRMPSLVGALRLLIGFILLSLLAGTATAALPGQSMEEVRLAYGKPNLKRIQGERELWFFSGKGKVVFERGVVIESTLKVVMPTTETTAPEVAAPLPEPAPNAAPEVFDPSELPVPSDAPPGTVDTSAFERYLEQSEAAQPQQQKLSNLGMTLIALGSMISLLCKVLLMAQAAKVSRGLASAVALIPFAEIAYAVPHWTEARKPILVSYLIGLPLLLWGKHILFY